MNVAYVILTQSQNAFEKLVVTSRVICTLPPNPLCQIPNASVGSHGFQSRLSSLIGYQPSQPMAISRVPGICNMASPFASVTNIFVVGEVITGRAAVGSEFYESFFRCFKDEWLEASISIASGTNTRTDLGKWMESSGLVRSRRLFS